MTWLDWVVIAVVGYSILTGITGGFARVAVGFAAAVFGILFAFWFYSAAGERISDYVTSPAMAKLLGFVLIFLFIVMLGAIAGRILSRLFSWVGLSWFNRLLGGAFGFVRGAVVATALVTVVLAFAPQPPPQSIVRSRTLPYIMSTSAVLAYVTPQEVKESFTQTKNRVKRMWSEHIGGRVGPQDRLSTQEY